MREQIGSGNPKVKRVAGTENPADVFTNALPKHSMSKYRDFIGLKVIYAPKCSDASVGGGVLLYVSRQGERDKAQNNGIKNTGADIEVKWRSAYYLLPHICRNQVAQSKTCSKVSKLSFAGGRDQ